MTTRRAVFVVGVRSVDGGRHVEPDAEEGETEAAHVSEVDSRVEALFDVVERPGEKGSDVRFEAVVDHVREEFGLANHFADCV